MVTGHLSSVIGKRRKSLVIYHQSLGKEESHWSFIISHWEKKKVTGHLSSGKEELILKLFINCLATLFLFVFNLSSR